MSGFLQSKLLKRSESSSLWRLRDEKRCLRHGGTMYLQVCDRIWRDMISSSFPPANKSMRCSKISSGSVVLGSAINPTPNDGEPERYYQCGKPNQRSYTLKDKQTPQIYALLVLGKISTPRIQNLGKAAVLKTIQIIPLKQWYSLSWISVQKMNSTVTASRGFPRV